MSNAANIIVDIFNMGTLTGDVFAELQTIFHNYMGDMGATPAAHIKNRALCTLTDRGFVVAHYNHNGHFRGYVPSERALAALHLENAYGSRHIEPRDAFSCRLVATRPDWAETPSALGVSLF